MRLLLLAAGLAYPVLAQLTIEPAGPCNAEGVSDTVKATLAADGYRVQDGGAPFVEVWPVKSVATAQPSEQPRGSDFPMIPVNALLGVIRYHKAGGDFRGQPIQPGVYTLRFNLQPEDGDHQGASPRRDHALLAPASADQNAGAALTFEQQVAASKKASGTQHPSVLFLQQVDSGGKFGAVEASHGRQALQIKTGSVGFGLIIVGKAEE